MYNIITTLGFMVRSRPYAEAGKILSIFTRELGLVSVIAQGIRLEKSKLRYHVKEYSLGEFSLVRGKEFWRLTNAQELEVKLPKLHLGIEALNIRLASLLKRLLHGEEPHPELFDILYRVFEAQPMINPERIGELESLIVLRMLNLLGYIGDVEIVRPFTVSSEVSEEMLYKMAQVRRQINNIINSSLQASQL